MRYRDLGNDAAFSSIDELHEALGEGRWDVASA